MSANDQRTACIIVTADNSLLSELITMGASPLSLLQAFVALRARFPIGGMTNQYYAYSPGLNHVST